MSAKAGNLLVGLPAPGPDEAFEALAEGDGLVIERIVSTGQATPPGTWLSEDRHEWVVLLAGAARLQFAGEAEPRPLVPGHWVLIPAGTLHRVDWTSADEPTIWLAVHYR